MASQRWVSDMQSQDSTASGLGLEDTGDPVEMILDNVTPLFAPRVGSVAALVAAAGGPTEPEELQGEAEIRSMFRTVIRESPPSVRRRHKLAPFAIAAGSVAGLVAGTAGLSAAAVLPPAASHVVNSVLSKVGIDVAPASTLRSDSTVTPPSSGRSASVSTLPTTPATGKTGSASGANANAQALAPPARIRTAPPSTGAATKHAPPAPAHTTTVTPPRCEVALIQNHVVLLTLPASDTAKTPVIPNAVPLGPAAACSSRQISQLENAATNGTGSSKGTNRGGHSGKGSGKGRGHHGKGQNGTGSGSGAGSGSGSTTGSGTGSGTGAGSGTGTGTPAPATTGTQTSTQPLG
jgi:hypothetical protein